LRRAFTSIAPRCRLRSVNADTATSRSDFTRVKLLSTLKLRTRHLTAYGIIPNCYNKGFSMAFLAHPLLGFCGVIRFMTYCTSRRATSSDVVHRRPRMRTVTVGRSA